MLKIARSSGSWLIGAKIQIFRIAPCCTAQWSEFGSSIATADSYQPKLHKQASLVMAS